MPAQPDRAGAPELEGALPAHADLRALEASRRPPRSPLDARDARLGGEVLRPEPQSLGITGTVPEWERWPGLAFPASGQYAFPRGLAPVWIDREADRGTD